MNDITIGAAITLWFLALILIGAYDFGQRIVHQRRLKRSHPCTAGRTDTTRKDLTQCLTDISPPARR